MLYAIGEDGSKLAAAKGLYGRCPDCNEDLISKCGEIITWHWAHKSGSDCEVWSEPESQWHLWWNSLWPKEYVEVPIVKNNKRHRADVKTDRGVVIELQHSPISTDEIRERESFYGNMVWVFDASEPFNRGTILLFERKSKSDRGTYFKIKWKWPRKSISYCGSPIYLDFGENLFAYSSNMFLLKKFSIEYKGRGWGHAYSRKMFLNRFGNSQAFNPK
jgi:hypothetical protein